MGGGIGNTCTDDGTYRCIGGPNRTDRQTFVNIDHTYNRIGIY